MATATSVSVNVRNRTYDSPVAEIDYVRLMYYLHCVSSVGPQNGNGVDPTLKAPEKLRDYANYQLLDYQEILSVVEWCHRLAPDNPKLKRFVVRDVHGEVCKDPCLSDCVFVNISADCEVVSYMPGSRRLYILKGSVKGIYEELAMFYTPLWLEEVYTDPLKNSALWHCYHCSGTDYLCSCVEGCNRPAASHCHVLQPNEHRFLCDGCTDRPCVAGTLYLCTVCTNYGLCALCYGERQVHDLMHAFEAIESRGATPRRLDPRKAPLYPPSPPAYSQSINNNKNSELERGKSTTSTPTMENTTSEVLVNCGPALGKTPFTKDDTVTLGGLTRTERNRKVAIVLSVDVVEQKAQVQVVGMKLKTFKVKWANMKLVEETD